MENKEIAQTQVSQDLLDQVQSAKALVTVHSLLLVGTFQQKNMDALKQSIDFVAALHKQVLEASLKHEQADLLPELVEYKKQAQQTAQFAADLAKAAETAKQTEQE